MTRGLLTILAAIEGVIGMFGLVSALNLFFRHAGDQVVLFLPLLAASLLLLAAGAAIFWRRPWSYYAHMIAIVLAGVIVGLNLGTLTGSATDLGRLAVALVTIGLTVLFLLRPVRRYFGV